MYLCCLNVGMIGNLVLMKIGIVFIKLLIIKVRIGNSGGG